MEAHTDNQERNGLRLPVIDEISLQEMILEAADATDLLDPYARNSRSQEPHSSDVLQDNDERHTHIVPEEDEDERKALLGESLGSICPICRKKSRHGIADTDFSDLDQSEDDRPVDSQERILFGRQLPRPSKLVQATQQLVTNRVRRSRFYGWRLGVLSGCFMAFLVLCCNIALVVAGAVRYDSYDSNGIGDLMYGDELTISRWNIALHIFINILSSILLAGSNYTMQVLSSPTRQEIDRAHAQGDWLEVGILSLRNLKRISRNRAILCMVMAVSSVPLHLFYNASTFKVIANNDYHIQAVDISSQEYAVIAASDVYQRLTNDQWREIYDRAFVTGHGDLYLVVDWIMFNATTTLNTLSLAPSAFLPWEAKVADNHGSLSVPNLLNGSVDPAWIPYDRGWPMNTTVNATYDEKATTNPASLHIAHAYSTPTRSQSRIQISFEFMMVVIAFNVFKLVVMIVVLVTDRRKYIVTLGDAAASFLERPEPLTDQCCLFSRRQMIMKIKQDGSNYRGLPDDNYNSNEDTQNTWRPRSKPYYSSTRVDRGLTALISILSICILLFFFANFSDFAVNLGQIEATKWSWGTASQNTLWFGLNPQRSGSTIFNAWLANTPQVLLSFCYLNLNTLCTAMAGEEEWNRMTERKGLRVTEPRGQQRSTHFLQLPYKRAVPLIVVSTTLHWVLSQSFFLVRVDYFDNDGQAADPERAESACGISFASLAVFCGICMGVCGFIAHLARPSLIPLLPPVENCSLMISAACHPAPDEVEPHLKEVQWGMISRKRRDGSIPFSLSSNAVRPAKAKMSYFSRHNTQNETRRTEGAD